MHGFLKQSTATQARMVGPFIDDTDFKTLETALTIANTDVKLSKNGAAGVNKNSGGGTHRNNGMYSLTFDATDTDTVGEIEGSISVTGALVVVFKFTVLEEVVYDALFALNAAAFDANQRVDVGSWLGTAAATPTVAGVPEVDVTHMAGGVQTVTDLKDFADAGYDPATNKVQGVVLTDTVTTLTGHTPQTGDSYSRLGAPTGLSVSADNSAIKTDTAAIKVKTDNLPDGIQKNTALNNFKFFMVLSSDHVTGATGLTITSTIQRDAGSFGATSNSATEIGQGWYRINLTAADLNADSVALSFSAATADTRVAAIPRLET